MPSPPHPAVLAALAVASALAVAAPATARTTILYESAGNHRALTRGLADGTPGLGAADGAFQQQPAPRHLEASRQAWKVSGAHGSPATPTLIGAGASGMTALLAERVRRSGAHLVFVDELGSRFRGTEGDHLGEALGRLAGQASGFGGSNADRVHIYVPGPRAMLAQPDRWSGAWSALVRAGGVWIETYRGSRPWSVEEWLAWPGAFRDEFVARGGDPRRLHLVLTAGDQRAQWRNARTSASCELLANGPGAYRLGRDAGGYLREFRAAFGVGTAAARSAPSCLQARGLGTQRARGLAIAFGAVDRGLRLGGARLVADPQWVGATSRVRVDLGHDPMGLARRLGRSPARFWDRAGAVVRARGAGVRTSAPLEADGTAELAVTPSEAGQIWLELVVPGRAVRRALGPPRDLPGALKPHAAWIGSAYRRLVLNPLGFRLNVPLTLPGRAPRTPALGVLTPPPPTEIAGVQLTRLGSARVRRAGGRSGDVLVLATARTGAGVAVPGATLAVRRQDGRGRLVRTDAYGRARIWLPRRSGLLRVVVREGTAVAALRITTPRPRPRSRARSSNR